MEKKSIEKMTIGRLAKLAGVGIDTIRFYEKNGIIQAPPRVGHGAYRNFPPDTVDRLRFIKEAKELGFTLKEIQGLLSLKNGSATCGDVLLFADRKLVEVNHKIKFLQKIKVILEELTQKCPGESAPTEKCPILQVLSEKSHEYPNS